MHGLIVNSLSIPMGTKGPYSEGVEILLTPIYRLGKNLLG